MLRPLFSRLPPFLALVALLHTVPANAAASPFDPLVAPEVKRVYVANRLAIPLKELGLALDASSLQLSPSFNAPKLLLKVYADLAGLFTRGQLKSLEVEDVEFRATDRRGQPYWGNVGLVSALGPYAFIPCDQVNSQFERLGVNNSCLPGLRGGEGVMVVFFRSTSINPFDRPLYLKNLELNLRRYP